MDEGAKFPQQFPAYLATEGVTLDTFNSWKSSLTRHLQDIDEFKMFLPGGLYSNWAPRLDVKDGQRIQNIHPEDPGMIKQEERPSARDADLLKLRNCQLESFIQLINEYSNNTGQSAIQDYSTSFQLILQFLLECHNLEHKLGGLFDLFNMQYGVQEDIHVFYAKFRSVICDTLKKGNFQEDFPSPTLEGLIILWCLDKINPKLSMQVFKLYFSQLAGIENLKDLREEIFSNLAGFLEEIENGEKNFKNEEIVLEMEISCSVSANNEKENFQVKAELDAAPPESLNRDNSEANHKAEDDLAMNFDYEQRLLKSEHSEAELGGHSFVIREDDCDKNEDCADKDEKFGKVECKKCDQSFSKYTEMREHWIKIHRKVKTCDICKSDFTTAKELGEHMKQDHGGCVCDVCGKKSKTIFSLKIHKKKHSESKSKDYECDECNKKFGSANSLTYHKKRHAGLPSKKISSTPQVCPSCGGTYCSKGSLDSHLKICQVQQIKNIPCEFCGKLFSKESYLNKHMNMFHDASGQEKERFRCETCKRSFFTEGERGSHVCKHFACDQCDEKFVREKNLKRHKMMHAGVPIFACPFCEALFEKRKQWNGHKRVTHGDKRSAECDVCHKTFKTNSVLRTHMNLHKAEKRFKCDECGMAFMTKGNLTSHSFVHAKEHPYECDGCGSKFRDLRSLKVHREKNKCGVTDTDFYNKAKKATERSQKKVSPGRVVIKPGREEVKSAREAVRTDKEIKSDGRECSRTIALVKPDEGENSDIDVAKPNDKSETDLSDTNLMIDESVSFDLVMVNPD